jgi:hypothetical protein
MSTSGASGAIVPAVAAAADPNTKKDGEKTKHNHTQDIDKKDLVMPTNVGLMPTNVGLMPSNVGLMPSKEKDDDDVDNDDSGAYSNVRWAVPQPQKSLAYTNYVYISPDYYSSKYVGIGDHVFRCTTHPQILENQIGLNRLQKESLEVYSKEAVSLVITPFEKIRVGEVKEAAAMILQVSDSFVPLILDQTLLSKAMEKMTDHIFKIGQKFWLQHNSKSLKITIIHMSCVKKEPSNPKLKYIVKADKAMLTIDTFISWIPGNNNCFAI